ncbi:MAG: hypothetical protein M0Z55_00820 [Peptococcaceae bacterium]|nr:hypothetical protein [Peptococcaceae bacterium]
MTGSLISLLSGALLITSVVMIVAAIYLFWVDIGGKLGPYARKISIFLGAIGWAVILFTLMPIT